MFQKSIDDVKKMFYNIFLIINLVFKPNLSLKYLYMFFFKFQNFNGPDSTTCRIQGEGINKK